MLALALGCAADGGGLGGSRDLGAPSPAGKGDGTVDLEVAFQVGPGSPEAPSESQAFTFEACGPVVIRATQTVADGGAPSVLSLRAESAIYQRTSYRAFAPHLVVPGERTGPESGDCVPYTVRALHWGEGERTGILDMDSRERPDAGAVVVFNQPDCDDGCLDPTGGLRAALLDAIQGATQTIDMAIYGLDDPPLVDALCAAVADGVEVRVVADDGSEEPASTRSYYEALFGPDGLAGCGAQVEAVRSSGLMHHKVLVVDRGTPDAVLVTGSVNFTTAGLEKNHNHAVFLRGFPDLLDAYAAELAQLLRHCASERLDGEEERCMECTPACVEDVSPEGPFTAGDLEVGAYFAPADDPLRLLRGQTVTRRRSEPDPDCTGEDASCLCRISGSAWSCDYCAQGDDGWGLVGDANERLYVNTYSMTDQCLALGVARAARRGVEVLTVWDMVLAASVYSRDDYLCAMGVPTWISDWSGGNPLVRNHSKTVVVDDAVFDGSMNLSGNGGATNNENVLWIRGAEMADAFASYVESEVALLQRLGVTLPDPELCRCGDLVDNDGDGSADAADGDCDAGE